jgi:hypothetical protein
MTSAYIDCPMPQETEDIVTEDGKQLNCMSAFLFWSPAYDEHLQTITGLDNILYCYTRSCLLRLEQSSRRIPS